MADSVTRTSSWPWVLMLVGLTLAVYAPVGTFQFVNFDDGAYVYVSRIVKPGISLQTLARAFSFEAANWHPLTWLSLLLDRTLFGLRPGGYHVVNALLHLGSTLILFQLLAEATGQKAQSAVVAALFAIHPLHVESVAWIAERKDTLSGLFFMQTLWSYIRWVRQPTRRGYLLILLALGLGLLAKQMLVTVPCVLLLLDLWPLKRWDPLDLSRRAALWPLIREKLPLFGLSAVFSVVVILAQRHGQAVQSLESLPWRLRLSNAVVSYAQYLIKTVWPVNLTVFYPYTYNYWPAWGVAATACGLLLMTMVCLWQASRRPVLLTGWLWYLGMLVPVIGLLQVGGQALADRYSYLPAIGLYLMAVWGVPWERLPVPSKVLTAVTAIVLALLAVRAIDQVWTWKDSRALWQQALAVAPSTVAHHNYALVIMEDKDYDLAAEHCRKAVELDSRHFGAWTSLGLIEKHRGRLSVAEDCYRQALKVKPRHQDALNNLGDLHNTRGELAQGRSLQEALVEYQAAEAILRKAIPLDPESAKPYVNLGVALHRQGNIAQMTGNPGLAAKKLQDAEEAYLTSLELLPDNELACTNLGSLWAGQARTDEAVTMYRRALDIDPTLHGARLGLAMVLAQDRRFDEALMEVEAILKHAPDDRSALELRQAISQVRLTAPR